MLPFPKLFNTSQAAADERAMLLDEIQTNGYAAVTPSNAAYNTQEFTYSLGILPESTGTLWGSPYGSQFTNDSYLRSVYIHCFPTMAIYQFYINNPSMPCYAHRIAITSYGSYPAITRNGYVGKSYGSSQGTKIDKFVYWDNDLNKVMVYNPSITSTPVPYY